MSLYDALAATDPALFREIQDLSTTARREPWMIEEGEHKGDNWLVAFFGVDCQLKEDGGVDHDRPLVSIQLVTDHVHASDRWGFPRQEAEWCVRAQATIRALAAHLEKP